MTTEMTTTPPAGAKGRSCWTALFCAILTTEERYMLFLANRASRNPRQRRLAIYYRTKSVVAFDRALLADAGQLQKAMKAVLVRNGE